MKRFICLLAGLLLALPLLPLAEAAPEPLRLAEIEQFNQMLLERAVAEGQETFPGEGGYLVRGEEYELLLAGEDVSADSVVLSAALGGGHEENGEKTWEGPRGSRPDMLVEELLALFLNDNPNLSGRADSAALYIAGELPAATHTGFILRDGRRVQLVEYDVYYQAEQGVVRAGIQFTVEQGFVSFIRSFASPQALSQEEAGQELAKLRELQEQHAYIALGVKDGSQLAREDFVLGGLDFFDASPEAAKALLGPAVDEQSLEDSDGGKLLVLQWEGYEAVFSLRAEGSLAQRLQVFGGAFEGPRGLRLGDTLAQAISRFEHTGDAAQPGALYGDAQGQVPPYGLLVQSDDSSLLYYVIEAQAGKAALMLEFVDDLLVSMTLTYL